MGAPGILMGLGLGTEIAGSIVQMHAQQVATAAKVQEDKTNQGLAQLQAASALQRGAFEAGQARMKGSALVGQQRADYAASGVDSRTGSAALVQGATKAMSEVDAQTALHNAAQKAWGYQVTANQYGAQQSIDKELGQDQQIATALGAGGQVAGDVGRFIVRDKRPDD